LAPLPDEPRGVAAGSASRDEGEDDGDLERRHRNVDPPAEPSVRRARYRRDGDERDRRGRGRYPGERCRQVVTERERRDREGAEKPTTSETSPAANPTAGW
jgi:hypothetical protein